jgi:Sulfotransferase domain
MNHLRKQGQFFIAGCARSGTTLLLELMSSFKDTHAMTSKEGHFSDFSKVESTAANLVLKREADTHLTLPDLPAEISLIYAVRHPFDTLTSHHPTFLPHRRFHVSERRWKDEFDALKRLRAKQPMRVIHYVRYCDLVTSPDSIQKSLATNLRLEINYPFSQAGVDFFPSSIGKYRRDRSLERYLWLLPQELRQEIKKFCEEFGYELPSGYVKPAWRPADTARRLIILLSSRNWLIEFKLWARKRLFACR